MTSVLIVMLGLDVEFEALSTPPIFALFETVETTASPKGKTSIDVEIPTRLIFSHGLSSYHKLHRFLAPPILPNSVLI